MNLSLEHLDILPQGIEVAGLGLKHVEAAYGQNSPNPKAYHGVTHSYETAVAAYEITKAESVSLRVLTSALIAGAWHDSVHEHGQGLGENEKASAELAIAAMTRVGGFRNRDYLNVNEMIMGTVVEMTAGYPVQRARFRNAERMADADLHKLGAPNEVFWASNLAYLEECLPGIPLESKAAYDFLASTIKLLRNHRFYTQTAQALYPHQAENLAYTEAKRQEIGSKLGIL